MFHSTSKMMLTNFRKCFPFFDKIKTKTYIRNLRHSSLRMDMKTKQTEFEIFICNSY